MGIEKCISWGDSSRALAPMIVNFLSDKKNEDKKKLSDATLSPRASILRQFCQSPHRPRQDSLTKGAGFQRGFIKKASRIRIEVCVGAGRGSLRPWQVKARVWNPTACEAFWDLGIIREELLVEGKSPGTDSFITHFHNHTKFEYMQAFGRREIVQPLNLLQFTGGHPIMVFSVDQHCYEPEHARCWGEIICFKVHTRTCMEAADLGRPWVDHCWETGLKTCSLAQPRDTFSSLPGTV